MDGQSSRCAAGSHLLHRHFLWLLIVAYTLAAVAPTIGQWVCAARGTTQALGHEIRVSAPAVMLAFLLFGAGLAVQGTHLRAVVRQATTLAIGLTASIVVLVLVLVAAAPLLVLWPDPVKTHQCLSAEASADDPTTSAQS